MDDYSKTWSEYVNRQLGAHAKGMSNEEIGMMIGLSGSAIGNWRARRRFSTVDANNVIAFWKAFGKEDSTLPEALAAAGYGAVEDYDTVTRIKPDTSLLTDEEVAELTYDRMVRAKSDLKVEEKTRKETKRPRFRARRDAPPV